MTKPRKPEIAARKQPRQARSRSLVDDILEAAVRVLASEGAHRFTTVRVAEKAGVSVGSLYQYFPNKQSLLFRLQANEWEQTWGLLEGILSDTNAPPRARLCRAVTEFFRSERAEADLRVALDDAGALFRDAPAARALRAKATRRMLAFMGEALPNAGPATRAFAADFVFTYLSAIAEKITAEGRSAAEVEKWAEHSAELLADYLERADATPRTPRRRR